MAKQVTLTAPQIRAYLYSLRQGDKNNENFKRGIINIFLRAVYLYDDRFTLVLNGSDTPITIDDILLDEIEEGLEGDQTNCEGCSSLVAGAPSRGSRTLQTSAVRTQTRVRFVLHRTAPRDVPRYDALGHGRDDAARFHHVRRHARFIRHCGALPKRGGLRSSSVRVHTNSRSVPFLERLSSKKPRPSDTPSFDRLQVCAFACLHAPISFAPLLLRRNHV